jgi:low affinity Fe/Cu permease
MEQAFTRIANAVAHAAGKPAAFILCCCIIFLWALSGPLFGFSDTWQLIINTGTTIVTFLMVFLIQNTQNRDTEAMQIKIDELIRATRRAENAVLDLEELDQEALDRLRDRYEELARQAREHGESRRHDSAGREPPRVEEGKAKSTTHRRP